MRPPGCPWLVQGGGWEGPGSLPGGLPRNTQGPSPEAVWGRRSRPLCGKACLGQEEGEGGCCPGSLAGGMWASQGRVLWRRGVALGRTVRLGAHCPQLAILLGN